MVEDYWTLDAGASQRVILFSKIGLTTERLRAIDLSCRECGAGAGRWAWIPGWGLRSAPVFTPNLRCFHKVDLNNCFGRVPRKLAWDAMAWVEAKSRERFGPRRLTVAIPKTKARVFNKEGCQSTRSYSLHLRAQAATSHLPRLQSHARATETHNVLKIMDIRKVIEYEFKTACLYYGGSRVCWTEGVTQGSNLAMGIAQLCGCYMEWRAYIEIYAAIRADELFRSALVKVLLERWVDDIYLTTAISIKERGVTSDHLKVLHAKVKEYTYERYTRHLACKDECASEFVGFTVSEVNGEIEWHPATFATTSFDNNKLQSHRYKHWMSNTTLDRKCGTVLSGIFSFVDRAGDENSLQAPLVKLFLELGSVGVPLATLHNGMRLFMKKFPYVKVVQQAWWSFLLKEQIFGRQRFGLHLPLYGYKRQ